MLFDSHAHMDHIFFKLDREKILNKCISEGVNTIINVGTDYNSSIESVKLAERYENIYAAVGVHPLAIITINESILSRLEELAVNSRVVAIGEIGLEYNDQGCDIALQKRWFINQLLLAKKVNLPVIIHGRGCDRDIIKIITKTVASGNNIFCSINLAIVRSKTTLGRSGAIQK
jgi:TatD DNase family protein